MPKLRRFLQALLVLALLGLSARNARALRAALVVGNNVGHSGDQLLKYAETDAERLSTLLVDLAGVDRSNMILLKNRSADDVRQALDSFSARLRQTPGDHLFILYYSGHADAGGLRLGSSSLPFAEIKQRLLDLTVSVRVGIVDACQSGMLTRIKGGRPGVPFDVGGTNAPRGLAILASASDTELAQESDELAGSFFTHHFEAGLRGLADRNRDGRVSLVESFEYASNRTLDATVGTRGGPQHPAFRYDLAGHGEVILSNPRARSAGYGRVAIDRPGWYFVERQQGPIVAEITSAGRDELTLEAGRYEIRRRDSDGLETSSLTLASGGVASVSRLATTRVAFGRAVRKGGGIRSLAFAVSASGLMRSSLASLGPALGAGAAGRLDAGLGSLELRAGLARATSSTFISAKTWEANFALAAVRPLDLGFLTLAGGVEAGFSVFRQEIASEAAVFAYAPMIGPTALLEIPLGERLCARGDVSLPIYALPVEDQTGEQRSWLPGLRVGLGAGGYF